MIIKKGSKLIIEHSRKGTFKGYAKRDFDTDTEEWFPIVVAPDELISGMNNFWEEGEEIPCRASLCNVRLDDDK